VYNKYKHIFTPQIGTYSVEETVKKPRIFIRDEYKKDKITQKATYVLPTEVKTIQYYEELKDDVSKVFLTLLESHIHSIQNCGRPFLIPDGFFLPDEKKNQWLGIVNKINRVTGIMPLNLRINVKEEIRKTMLEALLNKHIFVIDKDIIDYPENSLEIDPIEH
jgi:hypothetical protein